MDFVGIAAMLGAIIFSLGVHEAAHGWAAERFGDPTARELGRITLNPIKHIDPVFTILVPIVLYMVVGFAFGGAKPVPFNPMRFRPGTNIKRAIMWIAAAGPISNFILAFVAMLISQLALAYTNPGVTGGFTFRFLSSMVTINILLGMFNLLPIPPLDGAKVLAGFLPNKMANMMYRLERYAILFFFIIVYSNVGRYIMKPMDWMETQYSIVVGAIVRLLT